MHRFIAFASLALLAVSALGAPAARAQDAARPVTSEIPPTPAGGMLEWFVAVVASPSAESIEAKLGETLNDQPVPDVSLILQDLRRIKQATDGFVVTRVKQVDELELDVLFRAVNNESWWFATLGASATPPHTLSVMRLAPLVESPRQGASDWGDITWALGNRELPPRVSIRAERLTENGEKPFLRLEESSRAAIGPASKLFPLTLFAEQAARDPRFLERLVPLKESLESLISHGLRDFSEGESRTAGEVLALALAEDLTAVDQLIGWLGRAEVEHLVSEVQGPDSPNFPFLTTGQFYKLKTIMDGELYQNYINAETEDERRLALIEIDRYPLPSIEDASKIVTPTRVSEVEWRASADELCELLGRLERAIDADETGALREAFNEVSPQNREMGVWNFIFHVSGGEPGVFADAYLLERLDGVRFRFAIVIEDPGKEIEYRYFGRFTSLFITLMAIDP